MALNYWNEDVVYNRLEELNNLEGKICETLPIRAALH